LYPFENSRAPEEGDYESGSEKWSEGDHLSSFSILHEYADTNDTSDDIGEKESYERELDSEDKPHEESDPEISTTDPGRNILLFGGFFFIMISDERELQYPPEKFDISKNHFTGELIFFLSESIDESRDEDLEVEKSIHDPSSRESVYEMSIER
jgi:hypothetical protein